MVDYLGGYGRTGRCWGSICIHEEEVEVEVMLMAAEDSQELQSHGNERWKGIKLG